MGTAGEDPRAPADVEADSMRFEEFAQPTVCLGRLSPLALPFIGFLARLAGFRFRLEGARREVAKCLAIVGAMTPQELRSSNLAISPERRQALALSAHVTSRDVEYLFEQYGAAREFLGRYPNA